MAAPVNEVDGYIASAAEFARPILMHFRALVLQAAPGVKESIKWGSPFFVGRGNICFMAAYKAHCAIGFWNRRMVFGNSGFDVEKVGRGALGRITSLADLPGDAVLSRLIQESVKLDREGVKARPPKPKVVRAEPRSPEFLVQALAANPRAEAAYAALPPSHKREYVDWLVEAKRDETRRRRLAQALEWIAEGKGRNWQYQRGPQR